MCNGKQMNQQRKKNTAAKIIESINHNSSNREINECYSQLKKNRMNSEHEHLREIKQSSSRRTAHYCVCLCMCVYDYYSCGVAMIL